MKICLKILDLRTNKEFKKTFKSEFERDKFIRKSKYFKNIKIVKDDDYYEIMAL